MSEVKVDAIKRGRDLLLLIGGNCEDAWQQSDSTFEHAAELADALAGVVGYPEYDDDTGGYRYPEQSALSSAQASGVERLKPHLVALLGLPPEEAHWPGIVERIEKLMEPRASVRWFAEVIELALRKNDHKGGWHNDEPKRLIERIFEEAGELDQAVDRLDASNRAAVLEAADVAAMAMMVADHFREGGPSLDQGHTLPPPPKPEREQ